MRSAASSAYPPTSRQYDQASATPQQRCYRTLSVADAWWTSELAVPVIRIVKRPRGVDDVVFTVSVELPGDPTGLGEKTAVVPAGRPATLSETLPTEPPTTDTATVYLAVCLRKIVTDEGLTDSVKSRGETTSVTAVVCEMPPAVPVIVSG
jgi:hypothetical protein